MKTCASTPPAARMKQSFSVSGIIAAEKLPTRKAQDSQNNGIFSECLSQVFFGDKPVSIPVLRCSIFDNHFVKPFFAAFPA